MVMVKLLLCRGLRNAELAHVRLQDVDLDYCQIRVAQGRGGKDRRILFPRVSESTWRLWKYCGPRIYRLGLSFDGGSACRHISAHSSRRRAPQADA
jgi:site-specific recombinase XerC